MTAAALMLTQGNTQLQAAFQMQAKMSRVLHYLILLGRPSQLRSDRRLKPAAARIGSRTRRCPSQTGGDKEARIGGNGGIRIHTPIRRATLPSSWPITQLPITGYRRRSS